MNRLFGKQILITGGSQGLGRRLALDFASEGASRLALVARGGDALARAGEEVRAIAPSVHVLTIAADVARQDDIERIVGTTLAAFNGQLDVLVNNAATIGPSPMPWLLDYPLEEFQRVLQTNLIAPFVLIRKTLPAMMEQ